MELLKKHGGHDTKDLTCEKQTPSIMIPNESKDWP